MDFTYNITTPSRVIDIDVTGEAAGSFDVVGSIGSGNIGFHVSDNGITFVPLQYYSFTANALKSLISLPSFTGEEHGAFDVIGKITLRIVSSPDFQGNVRLDVCTVPDAPAPPEPGQCCPSPTVVKTVKLALDGKTTVWTPTPGTSFYLSGIMASVGGSASLPSNGPLAIEVSDGSAQFLSFHPELPASPATPTTGNEWQSPWITFAGEGFKSSAPNTPLVVSVSPALATGDVWVTIAGWEE